MAASGSKGIKTWVMRKTEALVRKYHKRNFYYRIMVPFAIFSTALICITTVGSWFWMRAVSVVSAPMNSCFKVTKSIETSMRRRRRAAATLISRKERRMRDGTEKFTK